jgi:hypothetical protein
MTVELSEASIRLAGVLLLTLVAVEYGGTFLLRVSTGRVATTDFQRRFFRAGHAHAAMLVTLALVVQPFVSVAGLSGGLELIARTGIAWAAVLMPAGFFLSTVGPGREEPNRFVLLVWVGAAVLAASVVTLGVGLLLT